MFVIYEIHKAGKDAQICIVTSVIGDALLCTQCHNPAIGATSGVCGHLFCVQCSDKLQGESKTPNCPSCSKPLLPFSGSAHEQQLVLTLDVKCKICKFEGKMKDFVSHKCGEFK